ncbi:ribosomal-protein-alanine N-acetyltransferase [Pseudorhodobacter antarcticus]|jgi:ribosomal-protein-alanine N-acetyltransferase|uniref:Ribosomal-protein-alanine N-acetyltransferase n=1 Tax=Pseudorhodobacter antarcticus TaxID=1077947 RepID=A0A1H8FB33_9RHOB|nr:GNAT family N-acetyltransferase [Pseudorhodobacter antarcticus]SEN28962.1 ribosomal-protein-alanine N-acetyltransferase [Pseudorhodobacter antarcticus]
MTPDALASLHARCFITPAPWSAAAFAGLQDSFGAFTLGDARGFVMGRVVLEVAEVLTLAVDPEARRVGVARALMLGFHDVARGMGAQEAFLEVAADNVAAITLYQSLGYAQVGRRRGYYAVAGAVALDGLVMQRALSGQRLPQGQDLGGAGKT